MAFPLLHKTFILDRGPPSTDIAFLIPRNTEILTTDRGQKTIIQAAESLIFFACLQFNTSPVVAMPSWCSLCMLAVGDGDCWRCPREDKPHHRFHRDCREGSLRTLDLTGLWISESFSFFSFCWWFYILYFIILYFNMLKVHVDMLLVYIVAFVHHLECILVLFLSAVLSRTVWRCGLATHEPRAACPTRSSVP